MIEAMTEQNTNQKFMELGEETLKRFDPESIQMFEEKLHEYSEWKLQN